MFSSRSCRFMYSTVEAYDTFSGPGYFVVASSPGPDGLVVCVSPLSCFQLIWSAVTCLCVALLSTVRTSIVLYMLCLRIDENI